VGGIEHADRVHEFLHCNRRMIAPSNFEQVGDGIWRSPLNGLPLDHDL
jgi:hypothetical protein